MLEAAHRDAPLEAHFWYPTEQTGEAELIGQNALFYGFYALREATPAPGLLPVVLLSHGSGGNAVGLGWLASELARQGFIVAAVNHPGTTSGDSDPFQTVKIWERPADLSAILDRLTEQAPMGMLPDLARVGTVGFSLGGHTSLAISGAQVSKQAFIDYCAENEGLIDCGWMQSAGVDFTTIDQSRYEARLADPRVGVTVAIDPALPRAMTQESLETIAHPVMIVNLGEVSEVPAAMRADDIAALIPGADYVALPQSWHFSFLQECSGLGRLIIGLSAEENICSDQGLRDRAVLHDELSVAIGAFLELNLFPTARVPTSDGGDE